MKDPALLFYTSDFLSGTYTMTNEQVGKYIRLLCLQHQKGRLSEEDMKNICQTYDKHIFSKFKKSKDGEYYNVRLEQEMIRRKKYSESRRKNRLSKKDMSKISETYEKHMETETETITVNINEIITNNIKQLRNSEIWIEDICMKKGYIKQQVIDKLNTFIDDQELKGEMDRPINDIKGHFISWLNKQDMMQNKSYDDFLKENKLEDNKTSREKYNKHTEQRLKLFAK